MCRPLTELVPKEKVGGLPVFAQALRLVPFTMPDHWSGPRLCEDLPGDSDWRPFASKVFGNQFLPVFCCCVAIGVHMLEDCLGMHVR